MIIILSRMLRCLNRQFYILLAISPLTCFTRLADHCVSSSTVSVYVKATMSRGKKITRSSSVGDSFDVEE